MKTRIALVAAMLLGPLSASPSARAAEGERPQIDHIVVVVLENATAEAVLADKRDQAPFLNGLAARGTQLDAMFGVDHNSLPNYLAMVSGHASTGQTRADCFVYSCVYKPGNDETVADQLEAKGLTWKAYVDGMDTPCLHSQENHIEKYRTGYATRHNPFLYFAGIVRNEARCAAHDVPIGHLAQDLAGPGLPSLSFIIPDTCHDGHDCPLSTADTWVKDNVGPLLERPEIRDHGLVIFTFDEADASDQRGCCFNSRGGRIATWIVGAGVAVGRHSNTEYNHYSLLRTVEDNFGLPCLRHACDSVTASYGPEVWGGVPNLTPHTAPLQARRRWDVRTVLRVVTLAVLWIGAVLLVPVQRWRRRREAKSKLPLDQNGPRQT
jgi:phosphatidylinositol-3-phosphatase